MKVLPFLGLLLCFFQVSAQFTAGRLVVLQVGDGSATLSNASTPVFLKEFTTSGSAGIPAINIPSTGGTALTLAGNSTSEGLITLSTDFQNIILPGYNLAAGTPNVASSTSSSVPRAIGKVNVDGTFSIAATTTSFSAGSIRGAANSGSNYWSTGANTGIVLASSGAGTIVSTTSTNTRAIAIFGEQLYFSTGSGSSRGIYAVGTGLPTSGSTTSTSVISSGSTGSAYQFSFNAANTICYIADDATGIQKWTKSGSTWSLAYTLNSTNSRGLTVDYTAADPSTGVGAIIYATTSASSRIIKVTDAGAAAATATDVVSAPTNTAFRGIVFIPKPSANLSVSTNAGAEAGTTAVTVTATASFAVIGNQTVNVAVTGTGITSGDYNLSNSTITILGGQTTGSVTFTVVDDASTEGEETATLTISTPSSGIQLGTTTTQSITIADNDIPGITIAQTDGSTTVTEGGATDTYSVVLNTQPTDDVTITITPNAQITTSPTTLTFTSANWNVTQSVTVTAVDDILLEAPTHSGSIAHTTSSTDAQYNNLSIPNFTVNVTDNEIAPNISINDVSIAEENSGTNTYTFTVSLSKPALFGGVTFDIATTNNTATTADNDYVAKSLTTQTISQGSSSYSFTVTVNGDLSPEENESFYVTLSNVTGATVTDGQGIGTITNDDDPCDYPTLISAIQGSGTSAALTGKRTIKGIVVGDFQNSGGVTRLSGFYVQEEDSDADADPNTSEGIFVFEGSGNTANDVAVGDFVCVTGTVIEFTSGVSSLTELSNPTINKLSSGNPLPTAVNIQLPIANVSNWERYESMRVNVSATSGNLMITDNYDLGRFGQLTLSSGGGNNQAGTDARLDQYTQFNAPSTSGYATHVAENAKRVIILDDGRSTSNPDPIIFGRGGNPLSASNTLRTGDEVTTLTGILDQRFEGYRVQTLTSPNFLATNTRTTSPPSVGASTLKVAGFNILNYFNGNGAGGGFPTSRGADNLTEFNRQRDKIIQAIVNSGADVVGLMELEDDGNGANSAIQDLVNGLNAATSAGTYDFVRPGDISTDEITVGMIYKPAKVELVGNAAAIPFSFGSGDFTIVGRRSLAQTIKQKTNNEVFTFVINHFKSKGSASSGSGNTDANDGQGASNGTRTRQAQDLADWLATKPTGTNDPDYLIIGDLNAYAQEQPLTTLATAGYSNLLSNTSYSYAFDGQFGSLDHALGNSGINRQLTGAQKWHINADEPTVLDYNTENKTSGQISSFYSNDNFRASDHDPIIVGLNLCTDPTITFSSAAGTNAQTLCINTPIVDITYTIGGGGTGASVTGLPDGITGSFSGGVFTISGSPTTTTGSPFTYTVTTTGGCTPAVSLTGTITVNPDHAIALTSNSNTENQALCINTAINSITYNLTGGATAADVTGLPTGVTSAVNAGVLTISGIPSKSGNFNFSITTTGNTCQTASKSGSITVNSDHAIALTSNSNTENQALCINTAINSITYNLTGGATAADVTGLPTGVTSAVNAGVLTISGIPSKSGNFNFSITTTGNTCITASKSGSIAVSQDHAIALTSNSATENQILCLNAQITPITYVLSGGATGATVMGLPTGVTSALNGNTLTISGSAAAKGIFNYNILTTGNSCLTATKSGSISINAKPSVAISLFGQTVTEGNNLILCDIDNNSTNNSLSINISENCVGGPLYWRTQKGADAWSSWSISSPTSQPSDNVTYRYQAACTDPTCPTATTGVFTLTVNYRASTPQNVSLTADGSTLAAGESKTICDQAGNALVFNATCATGEILLYSVDGGEYLNTIPVQIVDNAFHNYRVRCRRTDGIPSCAETESASMTLKITTTPPAPTVSITPTSNCGTPANFTGTANCGTLTTVWYNATTNVALPNLPTTTPSETTSYYARCQNEATCLGDKSNIVTFTLTPVNEAPVVSVSSDLVCTGNEVTISTTCPTGASALWNTGITESSFKVAFSNITKQTYSVRCVFANGCQSPISSPQSVTWKGFELTIINIGQSKSAIKTNDRAAWASQFVTPDGGPSLDRSTESNPTLYFSENANKTGPRYWTIHADACALGTSGSLTFDMLATPESGPVRSFNTHENNAPYFMYANREGYTELYAQNHPAYGFFLDNGAGGNVYDEGLPKGLYKLGVRYWDMKGWGSIYPSTRQPQGNVLAYQEYWFRIQSKDGIGVGAARQSTVNSLQFTVEGQFAEVAPNPVPSVLRLKVTDAKDQKVNVSLLDASGRSLLQRAFVPETNAHQEEFNVSELANGMYFLKVNAGEKQATLKVIKVQ